MPIKIRRELAEEKTANENFSIGFPAKEYEPIAVGISGRQKGYMKIINTDIDGVLLIEPAVFTDSRGCFYEAYSEREFLAALGEMAKDNDGKPASDVPRFVQDNVSESKYGVVRGLHFQRPPHDQGKLVGVMQGRLIDVAVDLRKGSPTYGQHVAVELSAENHRRLYIPRGFAHGFAALSEKVVLQYKCDNYYAPEAEGGVLWNDPDLNIDWGLKPEEVIVSEKDSKLPSFKVLDSPFR